MSCCVAIRGVLWPQTKHDRDDPPASQKVGAPQHGHGPADVKAITEPAINTAATMTIAAFRGMSKCLMGSGDPRRTWAWPPPSYDSFYSVNCLHSGQTTRKHRAQRRLRSTSPLQLLRLQVGAVFQDVSHPLVVDRVSPFGAKEIGEREVHEQVPKGCRVEHAGVVKCRELAHAQ